MHTPAAKRLRPRGDEKGVAALELAFVATLLFTLIFGVIIFGVLFGVAAAMSGRLAISGLVSLSTTTMAWRQSSAPVGAPTPGVVEVQG